MAIDKITNPALAAGAYSSAQKAADMPGMEGPSFGDMIKTGLQSAINTIKGGETASAAAVAGGADMTDVVQAVNKAELTLQTIVAIRDRLVGAYQEILRMPI